MLGLAIFVLPARSEAQLPAAVAGLTVDAALSKAADRVDSSVEKAGATGNAVVIRASSDVNAEISNFREAYKDMLQKTVSSLDKEATKQLSQIFSDTDALEQKTAADAKRVIELTQQTVNTIPFAKTRPQVTSIEPSYEVYSAGRTDDISLTMEGNFTDAGEKDLSPYVEANGNRLLPVLLKTGIRLAIAGSDRKLLQGCNERWFRRSLGSVSTLWE